MLFNWALKYEYFYKWEDTLFVTVNLWENVPEDSEAVHD